MFDTKYTKIGKKEGKTFYLPSKTNQDSEKEVNIHTVIEKYGIQSLAQKYKPDEEYYPDLTNYGSIDVNTIIQEKNRMEEYYENMPATVRKKFGDDFEQFYQRYLNGKYDDFVNNGILSDETVNEINRIKENKEKEYVNKLVNQYAIEEKAKMQAQQMIQNEVGNNEN